MVGLHIDASSISSHLACWELPETPEGRRCQFDWKGRESFARTRRGRYARTLNRSSRDSILTRIEIAVVKELDGELVARGKLGEEEDVKK